MKVFIISGDTSRVSSPRRIAHPEAPAAIRPGLKRPEIMLDDIGYAGVGDYFTTTLNNGDTVRFDCVQRKNKFVRFDSHDCIISSKWNETDTSEGGYLKSLVKKRVDGIWDLLPRQLQIAIRETQRLCVSSEGVSGFKTKLFLPDESELFEDDGCGRLRLYKQLDWYKDRRNRMKGEAFGKDATDYWTSSPSGPALYKIVEYVRASGFDDGAYASSEFGVPVCFNILAV